MDFFEILRIMVLLIFGSFLLLASLIFLFQMLILFPIILLKGWSKDDIGISKALDYLHLHGWARELRKLILKEARRKKGKGE